MPEKWKSAPVVGQNKWSEAPTLSDSSGFYSTPKDLQQPPQGSGKSLFENIRNQVAQTALPYFKSVSGIPMPPQESARTIHETLNLGLPSLATGLSGGAAIPASIGLATAADFLGTELENLAQGKKPLPPLKQLGQSGITGFLTGALEGAGRGAGAFLQKTAAPFAKQIDREMLQTAKQYGIKPTPSEVINETTTSSNLQKMLEDVSSKSIGGAAIIKGQRYRNFEALQNYKNDVLGKIAPETQPTELKNMVVGALGNNENTFRNVAQHLYDKVDEGGKIATPTLPLKEFANRVLSRIPEQERIVAGKSGQEATNLVGLLERINQLPDNISFSDAQAYRSQLLGTVRSDISPIGGQLKGAASKLSDLFDKSMEEAAKAAGTDTYKAYRTASDFYRQGKDLFNSDVVAGLAKQDPEQLAKFVFSPRSGENIGKVEQALDPNAFKVLKQGDVKGSGGVVHGTEYIIKDPSSPAFNANVFLTKGQNLSQRIADKEALFSLDKSLAAMKGQPMEVFQRFKRAGLEELINSKVFQKVNAQTGDEFLRGANLYETLKSYGKETLDKWLNPSEKDALFKFAKLASRINTKEPTIGLWGIGQLNMAGTGLVLGGYGGDIGTGAMTAGAILGTPAVYAKLITSNVGRKWLTEGFKIPKGTPQATAFALRFANWWNSQNK